MVSEQLIRQRSYEIWQREGCPDGKAADNWFRARNELEIELAAASFPWSAGDGRCRTVVVARPPISRPPQRLLSQRIGRTAA